MHLMFTSVISTLIGFFLLYVGWTTSIQGDLETGALAFILGFLALIDASILRVGSAILNRLPAKPNPPPPD